MKRVLALLLLLFSTAAFAQLPTDIELEAEHISYHKNNQLLVATDDVEITYKDYKVYSDHFEYDSVIKQALFPNPMLLSSKDQRISMNSFTYDFLMQSGRGKALDSKIIQLYMTADDVDVRPLKVVLNKALFSSCDEQDSHYHMRSKEIHIYPEKGYFVAKSNRFSFKYLPFDVPVPYYVYGANQDSILGARSFLPEFGGNELEGAYARYSSSYFVNDKLSGSTSVGYSENLEWNLGGSNLYDASSKLQVGAKYNYYFGGELWSYLAVARYKHVFEDKSANADANVFDQIVSRFYEENKDPAIEFKAMYQENEIVNNYWLDLKPKVQLSFDSERFKTHWEFESDVSYADIKESQGDYSYQDEEVSVHNKLSYVFGLNKYTTTKLAVLSYVQDYKQADTWERLFSSVTFSFNSFLNPELSYVKRLQNNGDTPFLAESEYSLRHDEIGLALSQEFEYFRFRQVMHYTPELQEFRQLDFSFDWLFHCWGIGFTWETKPNIFLLSFSIL